MRLISAAFHVRNLRLRPRNQAAFSQEIWPQVGQLTRPSRSVAVNSGGQQRGQRLKPNSPASVALATRRSLSVCRRMLSIQAGTCRFVGRFSRAMRSFSETRLIERRAECNASMSMADKLNLGSDEEVAVMCQFRELTQR